MVSRKSTAKAKDTVQVASPDAVKHNEALASNEGNNMSDAPSIIEFSEDVSQAEAVPPLPESEYSAEIKSAIRKDSAKGTAYAEVGFYIAPESYPADYTDGDPDGTLLYFRRVSLEDTPAARHRLRKFEEAIGATPTKKKLDLNNWLGCTATVAVRHSEYEGEKRAEIAKVVAP